MGGGAAAREPSVLLIPGGGGGAARLGGGGGADGIEEGRCESVIKHQKPSRNDGQPQAAQPPPWEIASTLTNHPQPTQKFKARQQTDRSSSLDTSCATLV